jgi:porin
MTQWNVRLNKWAISAALGGLLTFNCSVGQTQDSATAVPCESTGYSATSCDSLSCDVSFAEASEGDLWHREKLTGQWCGLRPALASQGVDLGMYWTQFYQGVAEGGLQQDGEYGGKLDYFLNLDGEKLVGQKGFFIDMHAETRYGTSVNRIDGLLAPANIAMSFPDAEAHVTSITGLKFTQALSENFALYAGKINSLDEYPLRYNGGPGLGGFMNTSLVFNPIAARTVPYSAAATGFAVLRNRLPVFTLAVMDPQERATEGMDDLYARGVVLVPDLTIRVNPLGLRGIYNFGGVYSNAEYTSVDPSLYLSLPQIILFGAPKETGSWAASSNFYQALWADRHDPDRSWGLFGQFGISDGNPNPIRYVANGGIGGRSMSRRRPLDTFGLGYFYLGLSDSFKALASPILPQQDERGVELFYNYAITPWCRLTSDLQVADPSTKAVDTVVIAGLRMQTIW